MDLQQYSTWFDDSQIQDSSTQNQGVSGPPVAGLIGSINSDMPLPETYRAPPRPLPYDTDPRYSRIVRDGLISRGNKSHLHAGEGEPLCRSSLVGDGAGEALTPLQRWNGAEGDREEQAPSYRPDLLGKCVPSVKGFPKVDSVQSLADDEEFCPTCFDGSIFLHLNSHLQFWFLGSLGMPICSSTQPGTFSSCASIVSSCQLGLEGCKKLVCKPLKAPIAYMYHSVRYMGS